MSSSRCSRGSASGMSLIAPSLSATGRKDESLEAQLPDAIFEGHQSGAEPRNRIRIVRRVLLSE